MYNKDQVCQKIRNIFPDVGSCGEDIKVEYSVPDHMWVVDLKSGKKHLKTFVPEEDVNRCLDGKQCVGLAFEVSQLKSTLDRRED